MWARHVHTRGNVRGHANGLAGYRWWRCVRVIVCKLAARAAHALPLEEILAGAGFAGRYACVSPHRQYISRRAMGYGLCHVSVGH